MSYTLWAKVWMPNVQDWECRQLPLCRIRLLRRTIPSICVPLPRHTGQEHLFVPRPGLGATGQPLVSCPEGWPNPGADKQTGGLSVLVGEQRGKRKPSNHSAEALMQKIKKRNVLLVNSPFGLMHHSLPSKQLYSTRECTAQSCSFVHQ